MKCNILSIKHTLTVAASIVFILPQFANAAWYWVPVPTAPQTGYFIEVVSPNTIGYTGSDFGSYEGRTITPDGFMDVMDKTKNSSKCSGQLDLAISQLRTFDSNKVVPGSDSIKCYGECGPYFTQGTGTERESFLLKLKSSAEQCLVREEQAIQQAEEERQRKAEEEKRLKEVERAVANCDFDFFNNEMTDKERMDTWEERQVCKAKDTMEAVSEPVIVPVTPAISPTQTIQHVPQNPVITPSVYAPIATQADNTNTEPEQTAETATTSNTSFETTGQTESEKEETEITTTPEPEKPTFFQRVIRFFTGWFN